MSMTRSRTGDKTTRCQERNNTRVVVHAVPLHVPTDTTPAYRIAPPPRRKIRNRAPVAIEWDTETRRLPIGYIDQFTIDTSIMIGHGVIEPGSWSQVAIDKIRDGKVNVRPNLIHKNPKFKRGLGLYIEDWTIHTVVLTDRSTPTLWPHGSTGIRLGA